MGLFDFFGKKPVAVDASLYAIRCHVHPLRLPANGSDYVSFDVSIENVSDEAFLTSLVVQAPKALALDQTGLAHEREVRLGVLSPGERKELNFPIFAVPHAAPGLYSLKVYVIAHYHDYGHVLNEARKLVDVRVV